MPMDGFVILWVAIGLVAFWSVGAHNRLVRLRSQAIAAFVAVDHHFMQHVLLIRTNAYFTNDSGLAELIDIPVDSLLQAWVGLDGAATQFEGSLKMVRAHPLDATAVQALQTAYSTLRSSWDRVQNEPPDLAGHRLPEILQQEWAHLSLLISPVSAHFNHLVVAYNDALTQFPANMLARLLMFKPGRIL